MLRAARASASSRLVVATASASASTSSSGAQRRLLVQASCAASSSRSISSSARLLAKAEQQQSHSSGSSKGGSSKWYHRIKKQASNVLGLSSQQASVAAPMTEPKQESSSSATSSSQPQPLTEARQLEKAASARDDGHFAAALRSTAGTIRERQRLAKQRRQRQHRQNKTERKQAALGGKDEAAATTGQNGARETKAEPTQPAASTSAQPKEEKGSSSQGEVKSSSQTSPSSSSSQPPPPRRAQGTGRVKRKNQPGRKERDYKAVREAAAAKGEKLTKKQVKALAESLRQQRVAEAKAKESEAEAKEASDGNQKGSAGKQQQQQDQPQKSAPSTPRQWAKAKAKAKEPEHEVRHEASSSTSAPAPTTAESDPTEASSSSAPTRTYRKRPPHLGVAPAPRTRLVEGDEAEQLRNISSSLYTPEEDWEQLDPSDRALNGSSSSPDSIPLRKGGILRADAIPVNGIDGLREMKVATLAHGLDRVLFNPGVHQLRDPRSGIYNYPPHLRQIPDVDLFDYGALPAYVTSSADMELIEIAQKQGARFCGSTSSLTSIFSHCYFLLSGWKAPEVKDFSHEFRGDAVPKGFSFAAKLPATINFTPKTTPGDSRAVYAIDSNSTESGSDENSNYVLLQLGKAMEKMLTVDREEFDSFLRVNRPDAGEEEASSSSPAAPAEPEKEAYYYSRAGNHFVMRSQLDCHDSRLPRKTFDLKSRACVSIRYDRANWVEASGYQIKHLNGLWESFERERYDMTRSAFLKYYFQGRIGNMDGIFVAYHNAARFFGFEYFPLEEMAKQLFGTEEMAEQAFKLCIGLTERVLDRAAELYPGMPLRLTFETAEPLRANSTSSSTSNEQSPPPDTMRVWIRPRGPDGEPLPDQITQLDVVVDRYIFGRLVQGPVDFAAVDEGLDKEHSMAGEGLSAGGYPGSSKGSSSSDDPLTRRPTDWHVEYSMAARTDLSPSETRANLEAALGRTKQLAALITPNVEAINERERRLEAELARNPDALLKYKRDKHSGVAAGMPRARGQVELFALGEDEIEVDESVDVPEDPVELAEAAATATAGPSDGVASSAATTTSEEIDEMARVVRSEQKATPPAEDLGERDDMWKPPTMLVTAMRIKSQRGAREARELEERDRLVEFESTSARERRGRRA